MLFEEGALRSRVEVMLIIFIVSLFAASFPSISKRTKILRIPRIVFFVGKHFGTGVILSTAFVHLLQDAFSSLQNPAVNARWKIGHWTGLIVLGSLISIFLVEYISTSYVDRLQSYASLPSSPDQSQSSSSISSPSLAPSSPTHIVSDIPDLTNHHHPQPSPTRTTERTPLIRDSPSPIPENYLPTQSGSARRAQSLSYDSRGPPLHRHHTFPHSHTHTYSHRSQPLARPHTHSHANSHFFDGHHRHESRGRHSEHHDRSARIAGAVPVIYEMRPAETSRGRLSSLENRDVGERVNGEGEERERPGNRTRCAHQKSKRHKHAYDHHGHGTLGDVHLDEELGEEECEELCGEEDTAEVRVGKKRQVVGILVLQMGIMMHSLVIGLTLAITSGSEFASLVTAITFHQLFEGLSLGIRISSLPASKGEAESKVQLVQGESGVERGQNHRFFPLLKVTLMVLFAITTPVGISIGLFVFTTSGNTDVAQMKFIQGLMCAISAGMLIYAACVEMLAGDFVMDATLWRSPVWKQTLALVSLLAGVGAMAVVGI